MKKFFILYLVLLSVLLSFSVNATEKALIKKGIAVEAVTVEKKTIRSMVVAQGTIRAVRREFLSFEVYGKVSHIKKHKSGRELIAGDRVLGPDEANKNGELLASLDSRDSLAQLEIARLELEQAKQMQTSAIADKNHSKAELDLVSAELKRMTSLLKKQAISKSDYEQTSASTKQAQAAIQASEAGIKTAISAVAVAESKVAQAQLALERLSIFSPINGIVSSINIKEGRLFSKQQINISSEASALKTTPFVIIDPSEYEVILDIPSFQGIKVKTDQKAFVVSGAQLGNAEMFGIEDPTYKNVIQGTVFSVSPSINPEGRSIQVKIRVKIKKDQNIYDGSFVNAWLVVDESQDAFVLSYNTLLHNGNEKSVFVLDEATETVKRQIVTLGIRGLHGVEVTQGLSYGDKVIGKGKNRLTDGSTVNIVAVRGEPE